MMARARPSIGFFIRTALVGQVLLAVLLLASETDFDWLRAWMAGTPSPTGPISPGDQVRRYEPRRATPDFVAPSADPAVDFPEALPERLSFSMRSAAGDEPAVLLHGAIAPGDADRLQRYFEGLDASPSLVLLNSPGGAVNEALEIGRLLRERELDTSVLAGMSCLSSCPYVLAAGTERRIVSLGGAVGLHQHYFDTPGYLPVFLAVEDIQHGHGQTMEYLISMGVEPSLMLFSLNTPPDEIYVLVENELTDSNLATEIID